MTYAVEFRSPKVLSLELANTLCERVREALAHLPYQGSVRPIPGFVDEWRSKQRVWGWGWGHFENRDEAERYAMRVQKLLASLVGVEAFDVGPVGYEGKGCGGVNWDNVEEI